MTQEQIATYIVYLILLIAAGAGEYLHLLPNGTLAAIFFAVVGHVFGTTTGPALSAINKNTMATEQNTDVHKEMLQATDTPPTTSADRTRG